MMCYDRVYIPEVALLEGGKLTQTKWVQKLYKVFESKHRFYT